MQDNPTRPCFQVLTRPSFAHLGGQVDPITFHAGNYNLQQAFRIDQVRLPCREGARGTVETHVQQIHRQGFMRDEACLGVLPGETIKMELAKAEAPKAAKWELQKIYQWPC